uniref:Uncharacterized protein n=1 Tax=Avena sativa TaxID=4498 RepID=A0ACD5U3G9_AVESA
MENKAHQEPSKLPYKLIKQITNDFGKERILGSGGFGTVYKGVHENRGEIAVKVLHNISGLDDQEFHKEFDNLRGLKHPNIVELVGFCSESEEELAVFEGKQVTAERLRMALCFEYVHNGSLSKIISDEKTGLTWHTRYKIIKGICEGLKYLREGLEYPIMHFDLKPDNILLTKSMVPKIADFGLSKLFGQENTRKTMSSAGTCGYWPPEYVKHQIISREFDIFSLGVIIVRIMTGHERYNSIVEMPTRKSIKLVHESWRTRLSGTLSHVSLQVYCNQVKRCIEIALNCLISNRQERPTIQDIVSSLNETEAMIGVFGMPNEQFYQEDGESALPSDASSITINSRPSLENFPAMEPRVMPLSLLKEMTDDFSEEQLIGYGEHGLFFKGVHRDGQVVAVKMLRKLYGNDDKQLENEIAILQKLRHQNIVHFIGYCHETEEVVAQYEGRHVIVEEIRNLVCFEYLGISGSLDKHISKDMNSGLNWQTRYGIIKGTCEGLKYLHEGLESPIIHMDLKPKNILMDENMMPKIGHFGSARLVGVGNNTHMTTSMMGTIGYMPPEFVRKQVISKEFDIFSLGVTTLQLMTGRLSYHEFLEMPSQEFIDKAHEKWREKLQKTVDVTLVEGYCQQVKKCLEIAVKCVEFDRHKRPPIGAIVHELNETEMLILQLETDPVSKLDSEDSELLLQVHPLELCFLAAMSSSMELPRKKKSGMMSSSCSLQLENKGNDRVAFMLVANSPKRYLTKEPLCGVVPPRCAYTITLTMPKQPPLLDNGDFFTLSSVTLGVYDLDKDSVAIEYDKFFQKAKEMAGDRDEVVQEVILKTIWDQSPQGTSSSASTRPAVEIITMPDAQQVAVIDVHPTKPWIMTTHHMGSLRVWNYNTMTTLNSIHEVTDQPVHVAKFIAREKWLVAGDSSGCIHVYSYEEHEDVVTFDAHDSCITTLAVHPTDPFVLSSSDDADHLIKLWEWNKDWECTRIFGGHTGRVTQVTFNPMDSDNFASVSLDGTVKIWSICSDDPKNTITLELNEAVDGYVPEGLLCVDYFTRLNRHYLIVGCKDRTAQIWKLDTKECVDGLEGHADCISVVSLHPELPILLTGSLDGTVRIWNSTTYKLENIINFSLGAVHAFGCIKGSTRIMVGCHQGIAMVGISFPFPDYKHDGEKEAHERRLHRHWKRIASAKSANMTAKDEFRISKAAEVLADTINPIDNPDFLLRQKEIPKYEHWALSFSIDSICDKLPGQYSPTLRRKNGNTGARETKILSDGEKETCKRRPPRRWRRSRAKVADTTVKAKLDVSKASMELADTINLVDKPDSLLQQKDKTEVKPCSLPVSIDTICDQLRALEVVDRVDSPTR